jgi:hypothetical protein
MHVGFAFCIADWCRFSFSLVDFCGDSRLQHRHQWYQLMNMFIFPSNGVVAAQAGGVGAGIPLIPGPGAGGPAALPPANPDCV